MKTPHRLEQALKKLYTAFHNGELNPECCNSCAVGTICDNKDTWKHLSDHHGSPELNYVGQVHEMLGRKINGYYPKELLQIEIVFLKGCGYSVPLTPHSKKPKNPYLKELQFNALSATIAYLCKLDGISNVMDYSKLFAFQNNVVPQEFALSV